MNNEGIVLNILRFPFAVMKAHAESTFPHECVGAMLGKTTARGYKRVELAIPLKNSAQGQQNDAYELEPKSLLAADKAARTFGLEMIGIYHSHPDADAYFSETDLKNSCPWYSFVVLSIKGGKYDHANSWLPDFERTNALQEKLKILITK